MTTLTRPSTESTDRRALLSASTAPSIAPSDSASQGTLTPRAQSPSRNSTTTATQTQATQTYRGFPSEAHYLAALRAWAEDKKYIHQADTTLVGYYGETTMEEYASRPKPELGLRRKLQERKARKEAARRASAVQ